MKNCKECQKECVEVFLSSFCSKDCVRAYDRRRKKLAAENPTLKNLICSMCEKPFRHTDKRKQTCSEVCMQTSKEKTMLATYGYANPAQKPRTEEEKKRINQNKKDGIAATPLAQRRLREEQRQKTNKERYGCAFPNNAKSVKKRFETMEKLYGTRSAVRANKVVESEHENYEAYAAEIVDFIKTNEVPPYSRTVMDKFQISNEGIHGALECMGNLDLISKFKSYGETQIFRFLTEELGIAPETILTNVRPPFMNSLELDLYLPKFNFAIEYHGLVYHSERPLFSDTPKNASKVKRLHEQKYLFCKAQGIKLFQIFEDEWRDQCDLLKAMLKTRLRLLTVKISSEKCRLEEIEHSLAQEFFGQNHISGSTNSLKQFGLFEDDRLVAALSLRKPWNRSEKKIIEIARFATLKGVIVNGAFTKLLMLAKDWVQMAGFDTLLTYADCRFGSGEVYLRAGFEHQGKTDPNYFYEKGGIRENRFKHRKNADLLGETEREQQNLLGWYAIYDAGSEIYHFDLQKT